MAPSLLANKPGFILESLGPRSPLTSEETRALVYRPPPPATSTTNFLSYPYHLSRMWRNTFLLARSTTFHNSRISSFSSEPSLAPVAPAVIPKSTTK